MAFMNLFVYIKKRLLFQNPLTNKNKSVISFHISTHIIYNRINRCYLVRIYKMPLTRKTIGAFILVCVLISLQSCRATRSPVERLATNLRNVPEYSIILEDMQTSGSIFKQYNHRYKVIIGDKANYTDWLRVSESFYRQNQNYLGMALLSKTEDGYVKTPSPPGYQYVGNSRYGEWRRDSSGNSFWAFYGQYMFMSHMFGMVNRPVYRDHYSTYTDYRRNNRPYYGPKNQYGTNGTVTKQTNKSFFQRKMAKQRMAKQSFGQRVKQRIGRSQSPFRSRGGGFGK
ncbi:MAG: hypothetical protein SCARUB_02317 [Candidatus Scalindua rubra]|uniref:Uncharacterized protein n=1 Tax=Candidatus Scalindua rubra TaxID=1872076 RepID=A0A1E3XAA6_9BACT|nr:MAG: hypothetical protein SCARUB_02317 [Candidatus Scalindua rubra]